MKQKKTIANFFWNSRELSLYEYACLKSFIKNDFIVNVYSYKKIKLPKGAKLKDAKNILNENETRKFIHHGKTGCLAAFTDKFRIELQKKNLGWWFDIDVICLKKAKFFYDLEKNKEFVIGFETFDKINNAVLKINNIKLCKSILNEISRIGYIFKWGTIGPNLIQKILKKNNDSSKILNKTYFYPINYKNFYTLLLPRYVNFVKKNTKNSYTCHNYNEILNRFGIPKNIMPPKKSFLYEQFIKYCPELRSFETLPENTINRLLEKKNSFKENIKDLIPSFIRAIK